MNSLVYIHVPKCGGTSFGSALRLRYFYSQATIDLRNSRALQRKLNPAARGLERIKIEYSLRDTLLARLMERRVSCISAHARYHPELHAAHWDRSTFVTLLRDPVDRFVSHYHYLQRHHPNPTRATPFEAFLETEDAQRLAAQFLFYFGRTLPFETSDLDEAITEAQSALGKFALVGDLSRTNAFHRALRTLVRGPVPMIRRNRAPIRATRPDGDILRRVMDLCAADMAIYDHAQSLRQCA